MNQFGESNDASVRDVISEILCFQASTQSYGTTHLPTIIIILIYMKSQEQPPRLSKSNLLSHATQHNGPDQLYQNVLPKHDITWLAVDRDMKKDNFPLPLLLPQPRQAGIINKITKISPSILGNTHIITLHKSSAQMSFHQQKKSQHTGLAFLHLLQTSSISTSLNNSSGQSSQIQSLPSFSALSCSSPSTTPSTSPMP